MPDPHVFGRVSPFGWLVKILFCQRNLVSSLLRQNICANVGTKMQQMRKSKAGGFQKGRDF